MRARAPVGCVEVAPGKMKFNAAVDGAAHPPCSDPEWTCICQCGAAVPNNCADSAGFSEQAAAVTAACCADASACVNGAPSRCDAGCAAAVRGM
eukprot:SAG11_NODE_9040_length_950_cov_1.383079_1_plen_93_part_10